MNSAENIVDKSGISPPSPAEKPRIINIMQVIINGTTAVRNIFFMLVKISVFVSSETSNALVETGEQRSPKRTPESIAPPAITGFMFIEYAIVMQMTPIVAAEPKDVPIRNETPQQRRNVISTKTLGFMSFTADEMMNGIVPLALHDAVSIPTMRKTIRTFFAVLTPSKIIFNIDFKECFLINA